MSQAVAYGSITVVDVTDLGNLSVQPSSNMPLTVVYDPDASGTKYAPTWSSSNKLILEPIIYYGATQLFGNSTGVSIGWTRKEGTAAATALTSGETINNSASSDKGRLEVSENKFAGNPPSIANLTYIVSVTYTEPTTNTQLHASGQITFSLVQNASRLKTARIQGDTVFKYHANALTPYNHPAESPAVPHITLTADIKNVTITAWQLRKANGDYITYPGSGTSTTLDVNYNATYGDNVSIFDNDVAVIRLLCSDGVYDLHEIINLYDGADGVNDVSAVLDNEDQMIPYNNSTDDFSLAYCRIYIFEGGEDTTSTWNVTASASNVAFSYVTNAGAVSQSATPRIHVTAFTNGATSGTVTFTCTKSGMSNIIKTFSVARILSGADGHSPTIYSIEPTTLSMNRTISGTLSPSSVTFNSFVNTYSTSSDAYVKSAYTGMFKIFADVTIDAVKNNTYDTTTNPIYETGTAESSITCNASGGGGIVAIPAGTRTLLGVIYENGAFTKMLDYQTVVITYDGQTGATGATGASGAAAINVLLGNYADVIPLNQNGEVAENTTITVPFTAYRGTSKIACSISSTKANCKLPFTDNSHQTGYEPSVFTNATSSNSYTGTISWTISAGAVPTNNIKSGTLSITFSAASTSVVKVYTWSTAKSGADGQNSVLLQIFTPTGTNVFSTGVPTLQMQGYLTDGSQAVSSGITWKWYKWKNNSGTWQYVELSSDSASHYTGTGTSTLTVYPVEVESYASYKLTATYNSQTYEAYYSLFDKTDPIQVSVLSSVGEQLVNGNGVGALYVKVTRNGVVIDEDDIPAGKMMPDTFYTSLPVNGMSTGSLVYYLNTSNKTVTLYEYQGSWKTWSSLHSPKTVPWSGTYTWSWRDKDGKAITTYGTGGALLPTTGKCIYLDGDMVNGKIIADVEVTI